VTATRNFCIEETEGGRARDFLGKRVVFWWFVGVDEMGGWEEMGKWKEMRKIGEKWWKKWW
jgi:hypothetical protein